MKKNPFNPLLPDVHYSKINGTPKGVYLPISKLNSLRLKSSVVLKWASKYLEGGTIYFAVDGTLQYTEPVLQQLFQTMNSCLFHAII